MKSIIRKVVSYKLQLLKIEDVTNVYSGEPNMCMCGCSGTYYYAKKFQKLSSKRRGYEVTDEEINDGMIKKVVDLMNNHINDVQIYDEGDILEFQLNENRTYFAYLKDRV